MAKRKPKYEAELDNAVVEEDSIDGFGTVAVALGAAEEAGPGGHRIITKDQDDGPKPTDLEWTDYVLKQFAPDELVDRRPTADGLRRVSELLLGPIVKSVVTQVHGATRDNQFRATAAVEVSFAWGGNPADIRTFGELADAFEGNCDPEFARFSAAMAATRAEARALRKALKLRRVVAADELTRLPVSESGLGEYITNSQMKTIRKICRDSNVSIQAILPKKVSRLGDIKYETAIEMIQKLNRFMQGTPVPKELQGYEEDSEQRIS